MSHTHRSVRAGVTLIELLIAMSLLGLVAAVVTLAPRVFDRPRSDDPQQMLADSLHTAIETGHSITIVTSADDVQQSATAWPDGSVVADSLFLYERLSGRRTDIK